MTKLWHKPSITQIHPLIESFLSADDATLDEKLAVYDITVSLGHIEGLLDAGVLDEAEYKTLQHGLTDLLKKAKRQGLIVTAADEDIHTVVEKKLTASVGAVAGKLHTGRSRNDQIATDLKLYAKDQLRLIIKEINSLKKACESFIAQHGDLPMPGYTHMQRAMPSSINIWLGAIMAGLSNDIQSLQHAYALNDQCPLGSAAGYSTPLPYDKALVAEKLGFAKAYDNPLYCQNSRGKIELVTAQALHQVLLTINKLASDLLLFTTAEFSFFTLPDECLTGSSIMAHKKNYDVVEILRSQAAALSGHCVHIATICSNLPSGYNRDFQELKQPLIASFGIVLKSLPVAKLVIDKLQPNVETLKQSITPDMLVTSAVYTLVAEGVPFREAYQQVGAQYQSGTFQVPPA